MAKKLVIVESPAKAKTIGKILGKDYEVKASVGHIRDLPADGMCVDIENGFKPKYVLMPDKKEIAQNLRKSAKQCDEIFLASDPDREGEAIAWHLSEVLAKETAGKPVHRVQYNEITPRAVHAAFDNPGEINMDRVDAQQARRILDRIGGYKVSPMLCRATHRSLSAGRVQSVALRLICERERLIKAFKPEEYWVMGAKVARHDAHESPFAVRLARIDGEKAVLPNGDVARAAFAELQGHGMRVASVKRQEKTRRPLPPFTTSTLQQAASSVCGFNPGRTMSLAQRLYEGLDLGTGGPTGLITYMRTDSVNIARDAQDAARDFIATRYGGEFVPEHPNFYKGRSGAQEAHEAIRPTDVTRTPESLAKVLDPQQLKLYDLIWRRFVASQMAAAKIEQVTVVAAAPDPRDSAHAYEFTATASQALFKGFLEVMALDIRRFKETTRESAEATDEDAAEENVVDSLPALAEGDPLDVLEWDEPERKETKPPARFSEAALVKELEANGIGRPSTYAETIEKIVTRKYVNREKRTLIPTDLGMRVWDFLEERLNDLFAIKFTAEMETELDKVEEGGLKWNAMLGEFYARFTDWIEHAKPPPADMAKVNAVLDVLDGVKEWNPGYTSGKRTKSDADVVASIRDQIAKGEKAITVNQLRLLVTTALRYRAQLPNVVEEMRNLGFAELADSEKTLPPSPSSLRKLDILEKLELTERERELVSSFAEQARSGKRLSEKQIGCLDRAMIEHRNEIADFDAIAAELELPSDALAAARDAKPDTESAPLLELLSQITKWNEPTKRGRRVFDDAEFFESVSKQFKAKGGLSDRQRDAMKRMLFRYREQIADFDAAVARLGIAAPAPSARRPFRRGEKKTE